MFGKKNLDEKKLRREMRGIAKATTDGMHAVIKKFKLPPGEALKVFGMAYATSLADDKGYDLEEMFGEDVKEFIEAMDEDN